ncbi:MAG TPA: hypothetical protein VHZ56_14365 [Devosia sp.]|nr:hypothetical protein [Devosia sp.]
MPTSRSTSGLSTPRTDAPAVPDAQTLRTDASAALGEAQDVAGKIAGEASQQLSDLTGKAREQVQATTEKVKGMAGEQKDLLVTQVDGVANAASRVAGDLEQQHNPGAVYARYVADNAGKLRDQIRDKDVDELLAVAQDFGRKQPAAFVGVAALAGFAASRFLMASARRTSSSTTSSTGSSPDASAAPGQWSGNTSLGSGRN